ncbi:hypothetical protein HQQ94_08485 [Shewanella sp. VB17]|uniref:Os1348 family NHLP clan protein n=1 Tax=Shewanella sp. VB17 TaxID=2739432 RepID=UPI001565BA16|nr:Os1348 family NHLP clan protein [Shewanella sp. VB17]NRD73278.1 hypothetical protein [Shewanella sp. VB17]
MSTLNDFLQKLSSDADFMAAFQQDPETVMEEAELTDQEKEAIRSGDKDKLTAMTGDTRIYKKNVKEFV